MVKLRARTAHVTLYNSVSVLSGDNSSHIRVGTGLEAGTKTYDDTRVLVRDRKYPWKTNIIESTTIYSVDFPELPKPQ